MLQSGKALLEEVPAYPSFNGHPPLGVNATLDVSHFMVISRRGFNGHPPLGVNATRFLRSLQLQKHQEVSMGTHPWG